MRWEEGLDRVQVSVTGSQAERVLWDWKAWMDSFLYGRIYRLDFPSSV